MGCLLSAVNGAEGGAGAIVRALPVLGAEGVPGGGPEDVLILHVVPEELFTKQTVRNLVPLRFYMEQTWQEPACGTCSDVR